MLLAFAGDVGSALLKACDSDYDDDAICLARAAKIVWRDMQSTLVSMVLASRLKGLMASLKLPSVRTAATV